MRRPFQITAPVGDVLPLDGDLKAHTRVDDPTDGALIANYQRAAVALLDGYTGTLGRCILAQAWAFPVPLAGCEMCLPFPDCRGMEIQSYDGAAFTPIAGAAILPGFDRVTLSGLPSDRSNVYLTLTAGWPSPAGVPHNLKQAIRLLVGHWYENREAATAGGVSAEIQFGVDTLISPFRSVR